VAQKNKHIALRARLDAISRAHGAHISKKRCAGARALRTA